ncbi:MAG: hypothetical protein WD795_20360 [Woeseia sp.]
MNNCSYLINVKRRRRGVTNSSHEEGVQLATCFDSCENAVLNRELVSARQITTDTKKVTLADCKGNLILQPNLRRASDDAIGGILVDRIDDFRHRYMRWLIKDDLPLLEPVKTGE